MNICRFVLLVKFQLRTEHAPEVCYFCVNQPNVHGHNWNNRTQIKYVTVESVYGAIRRTKENAFTPGELRELQQQEYVNVDLNAMDYEEFDFAMPQDPEDLPEAPEPSISGAESSLPSAADSSATWTPDRVARQLAGEKIEFTQQDLNILANELKLTIRQKEHLASQLMDHNVVDDAFRVSAARGRALTERFDELFRTDPITTITYCWNVNCTRATTQSRRVETLYRWIFRKSQSGIGAYRQQITNHTCCICTWRERNICQYASNSYVGPI